MDDSGSWGASERRWMILGPSHSLQKAEITFRDGMLRALNTIAMHDLLTVTKPRSVKETPEEELIRCNVENYIYVSSVMINIDGNLE